MSEPYLGEIRMFGGNFAPVGWALCQGQILAISQNDALFSLIGTTYGGDGQQTFNLPNLQSRIPLHQGSGFVLGQVSGTESVTLNTNQLPVHSHTPMAITTATTGSPVNGFYAGGGPAWFSNSGPTLPMNAQMIGFTGQNQPHDNMVPYLVINFIIALEGIFPSQG